MILINEKQTNIIKQYITIIITCYTFGLISITKKKKQVIYTYLEALSMLFKNLFPPTLRLFSFLNFSSYLTLHQVFYKHLIS